jgi:Coenzyme PQQ synthesis protein D (PqqD)
VSESDLSGSAGLSPAPDVLARQLGDDVVLVHLGTNKIFSLNRTGARFWELLTSGRNRGQIEVQMRQEFDVSHEELSMEINTLLAALEVEGLVRQMEPTSE